LVGENGREKNGGREGGGKMAGTCADSLAVGLHRKWREKMARIRAGRRKIWRGSCADGLAVGPHHAVCHLLTPLSVAVCGPTI
jgi:hypothetical protein